MEVKSLIFYFYTLILAILYTKCVHNILISTPLSNNGVPKHEQINVVAIVYDTITSRMEYSSKYNDFIHLLKDVLTAPKKPFKETALTKRFRPLNIESLSYDVFSKNVNNEIVNFFNFLKENYNQLFNYYISSHELDEYNDNFDEARKYFNSIFNADTNNEDDLEKYFHNYYRIKKYLNLSISIDFGLSTGFIILLVQIDHANNKFNLKFTDYLSKSDIKVLENDMDISKKSDPVVENIISTLNRLRVYINSGVFDSPERNLEQLCLRRNYEIPSQNWVSYFHPHSETLCHVHIDGNGDCFFYTLKYLLSYSGINITTYSPIENVKESNFVPWYLTNIRKYPDKKLFSTIDLRYITTYYIIKYFPGYSKDSDLDSQALQSMLEMLANIEYSNFNLKKPSFIDIMRYRSPLSKIFDLGSGLTKKIKYVFKDKKNKKGHKTNQNYVQEDSENGKADQTTDAKYKKKTNQGILEAPNTSQPNDAPTTSKNDSDSKHSENGNENEGEADEETDEEYNECDDIYDCEEILEDLHVLDSRMYELIFFKLISLKENNITDIGDGTISSDLIPNLKGEVYKSKVLSSQKYAKTPQKGNILPFFDFHNIKKQLHYPFNMMSYHNKDIYAVIVHTTFDTMIKRKRDKKKTYSLRYGFNGDDLSYSSILNNDYHFTQNLTIIETKTMHQKACALFYGRTRPGHSHWGDETDYNAFQKMFNIGLITFMHDSTQLFFPKMDFNEYPKYFLIYFFSEMHFEPGIHVTYDKSVATYKFSYDRNNIPSSILNIS
ncbi:conserved Plasmodium protein, unknown function [Plasmodium chabaudi adami]|uniref:Uncharacterized protein n=1 Tax=Plasmodium chabaudi adami TaxID=5826 RepID=A0A1D3S2H9_PLACE|nr:conserved Plasmodium protein, unknown function [Plasmodium chabaudi adami]